MYATEKRKGLSVKDKRETHSSMLSFGLFIFLTNYACVIFSKKFKGMKGGNKQKKATICNPETFKVWCGGGKAGRFSSVAELSMH